MQVQTYGWFPFVNAIDVIFRYWLAYRYTVTVIVMVGVMPPKWHTTRRHIEVVCVSFYVAFKPLHLACSSVHFKHRSNQSEYVLTDRSERFSRLDRQPIRKFHYHFWRAQFRRMQTGCHPKDRQCLLDDSSRLFRISQPWVR